MLLCGGKLTNTNLLSSSQLKWELLQGFCNQLHIKSNTSIH